jgi:hypothetical protein
LPIELKRKKATGKNLKKTLIGIVIKSAIADRVKKEEKDRKKL